MHDYTPFLCLCLIALAYLALFALALRNAEPDPHQCPKDCPVCRGEYDETTTKED